jgi:hypothetical protein
MTEYKHDWIAQTAPGGVMGFSVDPEWARAANHPLRAAVVKVTLFDVEPGMVRLTQAFLDPLVDVVDGSSASRTGNASSSSSSSSRAWRYGNVTGQLWRGPVGARYPQVGQALAVTGDRRLKTLTFLADVLFVREPGASKNAHVFDLELRATNLDGTRVAPLCISMVRVIKLGGGEGLTLGGTANDQAAASSSSSCCDPRGVATVIVVFSLMGAFFCYLYVKQVLHTRLTLSKTNAEEQGVTSSSVKPWSSVPASVFAPAGGHANHLTMGVERL